uniref:Uncharacterized protein LOC101243014 n=1 Tax=Phallusia mammillata TaxID=59560 RepID=A0A6F9DI21_9ASCI|nr:uncharacterized protein LOC101243014 [Phallusia mammillata]
MLLESDIARLVLGYLAEQNMPHTFNAFLNESSHVGVLFDLLSQGLSSPYIPTLTMFGKTLCIILDEYSCMKETESQYLRSKKGKIHHTKRLVQLWEQFENASTMLRSYQVASLVDCHSHADRTIERVESGQRKQMTPGQGPKQQAKVVRKVLRIGNPQMVHVPVVSQAQKVVTTQSRQKSTRSSSNNPDLQSTSTTVTSSGKLNRRKKTQGAPKRLNDVERRDVERSTQSNTEIDPASLLLRNVSNNEPETIAVVGATILNHMKKCSNTNQSQEPEEPRASTSNSALPIDPDQTRSNQESIANLTVDSLLESDFLRPDNSEFMKDLETLLSLSSGMEEKDENIPGNKEPTDTSFIEMKTPSPTCENQPTTSLDQSISQDHATPVLEQALYQNQPSDMEVSIPTTSLKQPEPKNQEILSQTCEQTPDLPVTKTQSIVQNVENASIADEPSHANNTFERSLTQQGVSQQETAAAVQSLLDITNDMHSSSNVALNLEISNVLNTTQPAEHSAVLENLANAGNQIVSSPQESGNELSSFTQLPDNLDPDREKSIGGFFHLGQVTDTKTRNEASTDPDKDVLDKIKLQECRVTLSSKEIERSGFTIEGMDDKNTNDNVGSIFATPTKRKTNSKTTDQRTPVKVNSVEILQDSPAKCTRSKIAAGGAAEKQIRMQESSDSSSSRSRSREKLLGSSKMPKIRMKSARSCSRERIAAAKAAKEAKGKLLSSKAANAVKSSQDKNKINKVSTDSTHKTSRGRSPTKKSKTVESTEQNVEVSPTLTVLDAVKLQSKSSTDHSEPQISEDQVQKSPLKNVTPNIHSSPRKLTLRYGLRAVECEEEDMAMTSAPSSVMLSHENNLGSQNHKSDNSSETSEILKPVTSRETSSETETTNQPKSPILVPHRSHIVSPIKLDNSYKKSLTKITSSTTIGTPTMPTQLMSPSVSAASTDAPDQGNARSSLENKDVSLLSPYIGRTVQLNEHGQETGLHGLQSAKKTYEVKKAVASTHSEVLATNLDMIDPIMSVDKQAEALNSDLKSHKNTSLETMSNTSVKPIYTSPTTTKTASLSKNINDPIHVKTSSAVSSVQSTSDGATKVKKRRSISVKKHGVITLSKQEEKLGFQNILDRLVKQVKEGDSGQVSSTSLALSSTATSVNEASTPLDNGKPTESAKSKENGAKTQEDSTLVSNLCREEVTGDSLTLLLNETSLTQVMSAARELSDVPKPAVTSHSPVTSSTASPEQSKMKFTTISPTAGIFSVFGDDENPTCVTSANDNNPTCVTSANTHASAGSHEKTNLSLKKWLNTECTQSQQQSPLSVASSSGLKHWFTPVISQQPCSEQEIVGARRNLDFVPMQIKTSTPVYAPAPQHYEGSKKPRYRKLLPKNSPFPGISGSGIDVFETRHDIIKSNFPQGAVRRSLEVRNNTVDNRVTFVMTPVAVKPASSTFKPVPISVPISSSSNLAALSPITQVQDEIESQNNDSTDRKLRRRTMKVNYNETEIANSCFAPFQLQKVLKASVASTVNASVERSNSPDVPPNTDSHETVTLHEKSPFPDLEDGEINSPCNLPEPDQVEMDQIPNCETAESNLEDSKKVEVKSETLKPHKKKKKNKKKKKQSEAKNEKRESSKEKENIVLKYLNEEEDKISSPEESRLMIMESSISEDEEVKIKKKKNKIRKEKREKSRAKKRKATRDEDEDDKKRDSKRQKKLMKSLKNLNIDELAAILNQVHGEKSPLKAGSSDRKSSIPSKTDIQEESTKETDSIKQEFTAKSPAVTLKTHSDNVKEDITVTSQPEKTVANLVNRTSSLPSGSHNVTHTTVLSQSTSLHVQPNVTTTSSKSNDVASGRLRREQSLNNRSSNPSEKLQNPAKPTSKSSILNPSPHKPHDSSVFKAPVNLHDSVLSPCSNEVSMATDEGSNSRRAKSSRGQRRQKRRISLTHIPISPSKLGASPLHLRTPSPVVTCRDSPNTVNLVAESLIELSRSREDTGGVVAPESKEVNPNNVDEKNPENVGKENMKTSIVVKQKPDKDSSLTEVKSSKKKSKHKKRKTMSLDNLDIGKFLSKIKYE